MRRAPPPLCAILLALLSAAPALADDHACPPGVNEAERPSTPCLDRAAGRVWTPRLDWPLKTREPPEALAEPVAALTALLHAHPEIELLRVESHRASDPADQAFGRCLSCDRAKALRRALVEAGVHPSRLQAVGYGETRPVFDYRDPARNRLNHRFEWHVTRWTPRAVGPDPSGRPTLDRDAVQSLAESWRRCFIGQPTAPGIELLLDARGRLTTVVLDRPGPLACLTRAAIGRRLADGPLRVRWPAADRPSPYPPAPRPPPTVAGRACPPGTGERSRPPRACVSADGTRIWLPPVPRHPKYTAFPPKARPVADDLLALLTAAPQIARVRIEMHDYRDPNAGDYGMCRPCARAATLADYLRDHGVARDRIEASGHHVDRSPPGRSVDEARALGPVRYEIHIEGWVRGATAPEK